MTTRITEKQLQALCNRLNQLTGSPMEAYTKSASGTYVANIGNYHLDFAYGGVSLCRMCNQSGGVSDVLGHGHSPKRDLYERLYAYIRVIEDAQQSANGI